MIWARPVIWSAEDKRRAIALSPLGVHFTGDDTRVVARGLEAGGSGAGDSGVGGLPSWYQLITPSAPYVRANEVVHGDIDAGDPDEVIDGVIAEYRAIGVPFKWCVYPWTRPADLGERLERRGGKKSESRGMACDTALSLEVPAGTSVERVDRDNLEVYVTTMARGWDTPPDQARFFREQYELRLAARPPKHELYIARYHGEPAGTGGMVLRGGYGYLVGGSIVAEHRGRGIYRALIAARLGSLRDAGITLATTQARGETSAPKLEHLGFETLFRYSIYEFSA